MAANTSPIFPKTQNVGFGTLTTANNVYDGTGTVVTVFTAGSEGSKVDEIVLKPLGTNVATVVRFFVNNGSSNETAANNSLIHEETIAATTASASSALSETLIAFDNLVLKAGYKINAVIGTTVAAGIQATVFGGDY